MVDQIDNTVQKRNIVGDQDKGVLIVIQIPFQPGNMLSVQIVGRLVQKQDIRFFQKELGKKHLGTLTAA